MSLRLYAVVLGDAVDSTASLPADAMLVSFRELSAVVADTPSFTLDSDPESIAAQHQAVVDRMFRRGTVLPAPVGTIFRDGQVLTRWLELHYVALRESMAFVEDRSAARVHIRRPASDSDIPEDTGVDLAAAAAEVFRALRRRAVAAVPLKTEHMTGIVLSGGFLVEDELWKQFVATVDEAQQGHRDLEFDLTGPWAPYDFIRMQFGG